MKLFIDFICKMVFTVIELTLSSRKIWLTSIFMGGKKGGDLVFCDDPVIRVYEGSMFDHMRCDAVFNCYCGIAYHCTRGFRMILETQHELISLGADGVERQVRVPIEQIEKPGEQIEAFGDGSVGTMGIDYEYTLFAGQRLRSVKRCEDGTYALCFDDFCMSVVPHEHVDEIDAFCKEDHAWYRVYGCEKEDHTEMFLRRRGRIAARFRFGLRCALQRLWQINSR